MIEHPVLPMEVIRRHADLIEKVLRELLAPALLVMARRVLLLAEPAPLEAALVAGDVVAPPILLDVRAAARARLRVARHPLGRL